MTEQGAAMSSRSPSRPRRLLSLAGRGLAVAAIAAGLLLAAGALLPVPSTLMLWRWVTGETVTRDWVPLSGISAEMPRAVLASEDQRFCEHHGVDFTVLRDLLDDAGGPRRGGSTITMQVAKNVYLWHGRSYLRKALELPLALAIDLTWSKRRIMEVYLNVAELGEGIFGVEAAAQRYFKKPAARLTRREAAALAATLPNPLLRNPDAARGRGRTNAFVIQQRMSGQGYATDCVAG